MSEREFNFPSLRGISSPGTEESIGPFEHGKLRVVIVCKINMSNDPIATDLGYYAVQTPMM